MLDEQKLEIGFRFKSFKILKLEYYEPRNIREDVQIDFNLNARLNIDLDHDLILVTLGVNTVTKADNPEKIGFIEVVYLFEVLELKKLQRDDKKLWLPDQFTATLIGLSISTTRGIILTKFSGTILEKIIMPVIDPRKLVPPQWHREGKQPKKLKRTKTKK